MEIPEISKGITKRQAEKEIKDWIKKLLPCPFCGGIPTIEYRVDSKHSKSGSLGHFVNRRQCCNVIGNKVDLFFCNDNKPANYGLWANMVKWMVFYWNKRELSVS